MADKKVDIKITASTTNLKAQLAKATTAITGFAKKTSSIVSSSMRATTTAVKGATKIFAGLAVPIGLVAKAYANYETALVGVGKTANLSGRELKQFGKDFKEATKDIPVATNDLLGFAQKGAQLGVAREDLSKFAETVARLKVSVDDIDIDEAILSIAGTVKLMEGSTENVDRFASTVALMGDSFATTESKILHSTQSIAAGISRFNVSTADVIALATATSSVKIEAENARTQFQKTFQALTVAIKKGGEPLDDLIALTGKSGEELEKAFGESATDVFEIFVEGLSKVKQEDLPAELEKYGLAGERGITVLGTLANKGLPTLKKALADSRQEFKDNTKLINESNAAFGTLTNLVKIVWKRIVDLSTAVGEKLAPRFKDMAKKATEFFDSISDTKTIEAISDAFLIVIDIGGDVVEIIGDIGKEIISWFGEGGDVAGSLKLIRKLFEMDKILELLTLQFKKMALKVATYFLELSTKINHALSFEGVLGSIKTLLINMENNLSRLATIVEASFNDMIAAIKIKGLEVARELEIVAKQAASFDIFGGRSNEEIRASVTEEYDAKIAAIQENNQIENQLIKDEAQGKIDAKNEALQSESDGLTTKLAEIKTAEAETLLAIEAEFNEILKEGREELAEEQAEEGGAISPIDILSGDPEKLAENIEENTALVEEGTDSLMENIKRFFGFNAKETKKGSKVTEDADKKTVASDASKLTGLLANQELFGEQSEGVAKAFGLANVAINTGDAISNAIASVKGTSGYDYALQVALAVGSVMAAIAPAVPMIKGAKQDGGENLSGGRYLIGERGAEILDVPDGSNIIPNEGIGGQNINIVVTAGDEFAEHLNYGINDGKELNTIAN